MKGSAMSVCKDRDWLESLDPRAEYYDNAYCRRLGFGVHIYVFFNDNDNGKLILDICSCMVNPQIMAEQIRQITKGFLLCEMTGFQSYSV